MSATASARTYPITDSRAPGELAAECHTAARASLRGAASDGAPELEQITDFILTRTA